MALLDDALEAVHKAGLIRCWGHPGFSESTFLSAEDVDGPLLCVPVVRTGVLFTVPILGVSMTKTPQHAV